MTVEAPPTVAAPGRPAPLPWLLRRVNRRYRDAIGSRMAGSGLGGLPVPGYWALMVLAEGGTEAGRLQRELGVSKQAVSKLVDTLVVAGLVDRHTNRSDRRKTDLVLTARGRTAAGLIEDAVVDTQASFVAEVGAEAFTRLVETLERLGGREG